MAKKPDNQAGFAGQRRTGQDRLVHRRAPATPEASRQAPRPPDAPPAKAPRAGEPGNTARLGRTGEFARTARVDMPAGPGGTARAAPPTRAPDKTTPEPPPARRAPRRGDTTTLTDLHLVRQQLQQRAEPPTREKPAAATPPPIVLKARRPSRFAILRAVGSLLYTLGFAGEYVALNIWRTVRNTVLFIAQLLGVLLGGLRRWLAAALRGAWHDFMAPLRRFRRRRRQLKRARERLRRRNEARGGHTLVFMGVSFKNTWQLVVQVGGVVLPIVAAAVLCLVVYGITSMNYALAVSMDGRLLGHVADQSVVENAKGLLRDRISLAPNQNLSDWQLNTSYSIAQTSALTTTSQLVNRILTSSASAANITEATGLYIDGRLYAATKDGDALRGYLTGLIDAHRAGADGATPSFTRPVSWDEPGGESVYFTSGVKDAADIIKDLQRNISEDYVVVADGGQSLTEIAHTYNLTVDLLKRRNLMYANAADDFVPPAGRTLLIRRAVPFLQVQTSRRIRTTEEIPFRRVETETDKINFGLEKVVQQGVPGLQEVWDDHFYVDGELIETKRVDELTTVLREPVAELVDVGTFTFDGEISGEFSPNYLFPVPASTWSSRGIGYHRGMDINAETGVPILASNAGTVTIAGSHWSYGLYVVIQHPDGMVTLYGHCSALYVEAGEQVKRGQPIAALGSTGVSTGPHLHLEFQPGGGAPVDPLLYIVPPEGYRMDWRR